MNNCLRKKLLTICLIFLLFLQVLIPSVFADTVLPDISMIAIAGDSTPGIEIAAGDQPFFFLPTSPYGQIKTNVWLENMDTGEQISIFSDYWVTSDQPVQGTMNVVAGNWKFVVYMEDSLGNVNQFPFLFSVKAAADNTVKIEDVTLPVVVSDADTQGILKVDLKNELGTKAFVEVGWKWADDDVWKATRTIEIDSIFSASNGKDQLEFTIPVELNGSYLRGIIVAIDPYGKQHPTKATYMIYNYPQLEIEHVKHVGTEGNDVLLEMEIVSKDESWITDSTIAEVVVEKEGKIVATFYIPVDVGETVISIEKVALPKDVHTLYVYLRQLDKQISERQEKKLIIDTRHEFKNLVADYVESGSYQQGETVYTKAKFRMPKKSQPINKMVDVVLYFNGSIVATDKVYVTPGDIKDVIFTWTLPVYEDNELRTARLIAEINPDRLYNESTYDDNTAAANITITPKFQQSLSCDGYSDNRVETVAVVDHYYWDPPIWDEDCDYWEDEEGNSGWDCYDVLVKPGECLFGGTSTYDEYIMISDPTPNPSVVKAGMGYTLNDLGTSYTNSFSGYGISPDTDRDFSDINIKSMDTVLSLVSAYPAPNSSNIWSLPRARIERGQGDMEIRYFPQLEPLSIDANVYNDGDNKFYTSFYLKDEMLDYIVYGEGAGSTQTYYIVDKSACNGGGIDISTSSISPRLSFCIEGQVEIKGSPHDDYIIRRINPHNPFPQNGRRGWNWVGYDNIFEELKQWYDTSGDVILDNSINWVIDN